MFKPLYSFTSATAAFVEPVHVIVIEEAAPELTTPAQMATWIFEEPVPMDELVWSCTHCTPVWTTLEITPELPLKPITAMSKLPSVGKADVVIVIVLPLLVPRALLPTCDIVVVSAIVVLMKHPQ